MGTVKRHDNRATSDTPSQPSNSKTIYKSNKQKSNMYTVVRTTNGGKMQIEVRKPRVIKHAGNY